MVNRYTRGHTYRKPQTDLEKQFWITGANKSIYPKFNAGHALINNALCVQIGEEEYRLDAMFLRDACEFCGGFYGFLIFFDVYA